MKKLISLLVVGILIFSLAACGNSEKASSNSKGDKKITLWYWNRGLDEKVLEKVKDEFPNVEFVAKKLPPGKDYKTKLMTLLRSKNTNDSPDLVLLNVWVSELLPYSDKFVNLYDHGGKELESQYPAWKIGQAVTGDGKSMIALPVDTAPTGFFYREDIFKKAGVANSPEELSEKMQTWDGYLNVLTQLKDKGNAYAVSSMGDEFSNYLNKLDNRFFDSEDKFIGDQKHIKEIWDQVVELNEKGLVADNIVAQDQEWNAAINNNKIAGYDGPVWAKDIIIDTTPGTSGLWKVARSPLGDGNDGGSFLGVLSSSKNQKESVEIAKFINNAENQITSYKDLSLFPSHNDALNSKEISHEEEFFGGQNTTDIFVESAKNVKEAYKGSKESIVLLAFLDELNLVATQDKDPEKAWKDALEMIKRNLSI